MSIFDLQSWGVFRDRLIKDCPRVITSDYMYTTFIVYSVETLEYRVGIPASCVPKQLDRVPLAEINKAFNAALGDYVNYIANRKASNVRIQESLDCICNAQFNGIVLGDAILSRLVADEYPELVV